MKNTKIVIEELEKNLYDKQLEEIYADHSMIEYQRERYIRAIKQYEVLFNESDVSIFSAPGRSEVCGNHTDHQHGMVLAASVNLDTIAVVGNNNENIVRVVSDGYDMITVNINDLDVKEEETGTTGSLIRGMLQGISDRGYKIGGFNAYATSDVLVGAGLSSSAAFEVIIGTILSGLFNDMKIDAVEIAQTAQYAENVYFKKPCGLMDQMACSVGGLIHIDFQDPQKPIVNQINIDFEKYDYSLCIVDTKGSHVDLTEDYAMIPLEMKKVANLMGCEVLREVNEQDFYHSIAKLREKAGDRPVLRAFHFFHEEENVANAITALNTGNFPEFLGVIKKSGSSSFQYLQNVYTNRDVQNQNLSIALSISEGILRENGVCRVHGGGFAGTIQAFVKNDHVFSYKECMQSIFGENSCHVLQIRKYGGIQII